MCHNFNYTGFAQDNIKDKMRSILIEVSAEIIEGKGKEAENGLPRLQPILDAAQPSKVSAEVKRHISVPSLYVTITKFK